MCYNSDTCERYSLLWSGDIKTFNELHMQPLTRRSHDDPLTLSMWWWDIRVTWWHDLSWIVICWQQYATSASQWHLSVNQLEYLEWCILISDPTSSLKAVLLPAGNLYSCVKALLGTYPILISPYRALVPPSQLRLRTVTHSSLQF